MHTQLLLVIQEVFSTTFMYFIEDLEVPLRPAWLYVDDKQTPAVIKLR